MEDCTDSAIDLEKACLVINIFKTKNVLITLDKASVIKFL